jgi:hypothetical protein
MIDIEVSGCPKSRQPLPDCPFITRFNQLFVPHISFIRGKSHTCTVYKEVYELLELLQILNPRFVDNRSIILVLPVIRYGGNGHNSPFARFHQYWKLHIRGFYP